MAVFCCNSENSVPLNTIHRVINGTAVKSKTMSLAPRHVYSITPPARRFVPVARQILKLLIKRISFDIFSNLRLVQMLRYKYPLRNV